MATGAEGKCFFVALSLDALWLRLDENVIEENGCPMGCARKNSAFESRPHDSGKE